MFNTIHDMCDTGLNIFHPYLMDLQLKFWEIYQKCSKLVNFWARIFLGARAPLELAHVKKNKNKKKKKKKEKV